MGRFPDPEGGRKETFRPHNLTNANTILEIPEHLGKAAAKSHTWGTRNFIAKSSHRGRTAGDSEQENKTKSQQHEFSGGC